MKEISVGYMCEIDGDVVVPREVPHTAWALDVHDEFTITVDKTKDGCTVRDVDRLRARMEEEVLRSFNSCKLVAYDPGTGFTVDAPEGMTFWAKGAIEKVVISGKVTFVDAKPCWHCQAVPGTEHGPVCIERQHGAHIVGE